jgi:hypothetical protein
MTKKKETCWICSSNKHVDNHHYDCQKGKLSPETVPLCRRCHRTYHDFGIGSFSPDTTAKALEIENKRREILRSLPSDHIRYQNLPPLKLEDVKRSGYWDKKHGIAPPSPLKKRGKVKLFQFRIPNSPVLCGEKWLQEHVHDHTPEEISALSMEIGCGSRWLPPVTLANKKTEIKAAIRSLGDA